MQCSKQWGSTLSEPGSCRQSRPRLAQTFSEWNKRFCWSSIDDVIRFLLTESDLVLKIVCSKERSITALSPSCVEKKELATFFVSSSLIGCHAARLKTWRPDWPLHPAWRSAVRPSCRWRSRSAAVASASHELFFICKWKKVIFAKFFSWRSNWAVARFYRPVFAQIL